MAWNEENSIQVMLDSLFRQTLFARLAERGERCEIVCLANGCTDGTVAVTRSIFERQRGSNSAADGFRAWVADIPEPGREILFLLEVTAQGQHRNIHRERERRAEADDVLKVPCRSAFHRYTCEARVG